MTGPGTEVNDGETLERSDEDHHGTARSAGADRSEAGGRLDLAPHDGTVDARPRRTPGADPMKAIAQRRYGAPLEVLRLEDIDEPRAGDGEVLVRVRAAGVNALDWHLVTGEPTVMRLIGMGFRRPKRPGVGRDVAGVIEAVGPGATRFRPGDEVFGWCDGAFAEFVVTREDSLVPKPANVTFEQAAAVPVAAITALQGLRDKGEVRPGQRVLITGASGGVGTFAVQLASHLGAEVTAVCSSRNVDLVRSIGADHVVDYTREDFTRSGKRYDLILDIAGRPSLLACRRSLEPGGRLVLAGGEGGRVLGPLPRMVRALVLGLLGSRTVRAFEAKETREDTLALAEMLAAGDLAPVIDRTYDLAAAPEAVRYLEEGHTQGKVVITI
jgi:NADPH:quinone reductase-like Zn-dependent oxidoreductase